MSFVNKHDFNEKIHSVRNIESSSTRQHVNNNIKCNEKLNIFQRVWSIIKENSDVILKGLALTTAAGLYVALWVFCPPATATITLAIVLSATLNKIEALYFNPLKYTSD